jgi:hypothetical protein
MPTDKLSVEFSEHISVDRIAGMVSGLAAYGNVFPGPSNRVYTIEIFRRSKLPRLKRQLAQWEQNGYLCWSADTSK